MHINGRGMSKTRQMCREWQTNVRDSKCQTTTILPRETSPAKNALHEPSSWIVDFMNGFIVLVKAKTVKTTPQTFQCMSATAVQCSPTLSV